MSGFLPHSQTELCLLKPSVRTDEQPSTCMRLYAVVIV